MLISYSMITVLKISFKFNKLVFSYVTLDISEIILKSLRMHLKYEINIFIKKWNRLPKNAQKVLK